MLTYPKSTMHVWRIPMHLSLGHVTLMPGKFYPPPNFPLSDLGRWADSRWSLPQISSFIWCWKQVGSWITEWRWWQADVGDCGCWWRWVECRYKDRTTSDVIGGSNATTDSTLQWSVGIPFCSCLTSRSAQLTLFSSIADLYYIKSKL